MGQTTQPKNLWSAQGAEHSRIFYFQSIDVNDIISVQLGQGGGLWLFQSVTR